MEGVPVQGQTGGRGAAAAGGGALPPQARLADVVRRTEPGLLRTMVAPAGRPSAPERQADAGAYGSQPLSGPAAGLHPRAVLRVPVYHGRGAAADRPLVGSPAGGRVSAAAVAAAARPDRKSTRLNSSH